MQRNTTDIKNNNLLAGLQKISEKSQKMRNHFFEGYENEYIKNNKEFDANIFDEKMLNNHNLKTKNRDKKEYKNNSHKIETPKNRILQNAYNIINESNNNDNINKKRNSKNNQNEIQRGISLYNESENKTGILNYNNNSLKNIPIEKNTQTKIISSSHYEIKKNKEEQSNFDNKLLTKQLENLNVQFPNYGILNNKGKELSSNYNLNNNNLNLNKNLNNRNENTVEIIDSLIGLNNLGNTCYINTCLQILMHTPNFINRFFNDLNKICSETPISKQFYNLITQVINAKNISTKEFYEVFSKKHKNFSGNEENDTQEFCRVFLEDINRELNNVKKKVPYIELDTKNKNKIDCDLEYNNLFKIRDDSLVIDSFYGQIINIFTCECNFTTYSFQKILDIPLLIPKTKNNEKCDLIDLIKYYFQSELIELDIICNFCKQKCVHNKQTFFSYPPEILILSLQRLNRKKKKNKVEIDFDEQLNLSSFIDKDCYNNNNYKYNLYAVANHHGKIETGHYYAYIKIRENWFEFNDSKVKKIKNIENSFTEAYILFYKRNDIN